MKKSHLNLIWIIRRARFGAFFFCLLQPFPALSAPHAYRQRDDSPPATYAKCWEYPTAANLSVAAGVDSVNAYFVDSNRRLEAVDLSLGVKVWSTELAGDAVSNLLVTDESIIVATNPSEGSADAAKTATLLSVSKQTGITNWTAELSPSLSATLGSLNGYVLAISASGAVAAFSAATGRPAWSVKAGGGITTAPYFGSNFVLIGTDEKEVIEVAAAGGNISAIFRMEGSPTAVFLDASGRIVAGDDRGNLVLTSTDGRRLWRFRNGARISSIAGYDSEFLVTSHDNFVYKVSRSGNVEWKRRLSGRPVARPLVIGEIGFVATVGDGMVYALDLTNGKIINRIETVDDNSAQLAVSGKGLVVIAANRVVLFRSDECRSVSKKTAP